MSEELSDLEITKVIAERVMGYHIVYSDHIYGDDDSAIYPKLIVSPQGHTTRIGGKGGGWTLFYPPEMIHSAWDVVEEFQRWRDPLHRKYNQWVNFANMVRGSMIYELPQKDACRAICRAALASLKGERE
jgi:hypothetical protein